MEKDQKVQKFKKFKKFRFHFLIFFLVKKKSKSSGVKSSNSKCLASECFGLTSQKQKNTHTETVKQNSQPQDTHIETSKQMSQPQDKS